MTYVEFCEAIAAELRRAESGLTWRQIKERLDLPYDRPCPSWIRRMEREKGLSRRRESGRALVWRIR